MEQEGPVWHIMGAERALFRLVSKLGKSARSQDQ